MASEFFEEFGVFGPDAFDLFFAGLFLGFGAGGVVDGGEDDDAEEADEGEAENIEDDDVPAGGECGVAELEEDGEGEDEKEAGEGGEAGGEAGKGAEVIVPGGAEDGEEDGNYPRVHPIDIWAGVKQEDCSHDYDWYD